MGESPGAALRRMILDGVHPEQAAAGVLDEALGDAAPGLDAGVYGWLRALVVREARHLEGRLGNRRARRVLGPAGWPAGSARFAEQSQKLRTTIYHLPDGTRVQWQEMTLDWVEVKIAEFRKHIGRYSEHLAVLLSVRELLAERDAARLGDIPEWPELVRKLADGRAGWVADAGEEALADLGDAGPDGEADAA